VTQELQQLTRSRGQAVEASKPNALPPSRYRNVPARIALAAATLIGAFGMSYYFLKDDLFANKVKRTAGVTRQTSIQKQYALAIVENDLNHWLAVSENFPACDKISTDYGLKAKLQTARLLIEGKNYLMAAEVLMSVLKSDYTEEAIPAIAKIEMGYVTGRMMIKEIRHNYYEDAASTLSVMEDRKKRLVLDALPSNVREEWGRNAPSESNDVKSSD
jgi:hypothetical protein